MTIFETDALNPAFRTHLRLVEPDDAAFICELRTNPTLNIHLNPSSADVGKQREWIEIYKKREAEGREFYFVVVSDMRDVGLVRMYDFRDDSRSFCWGSWIIRPPRSPGLVTFSAILIYEIGFDALGFTQSHFDVRNSNAGVIAFHRRSGAEEVRKDDCNTYFIFGKSNYAYFRKMSKIRIDLHRTICSEN